MPSLPIALVIGIAALAIAAVVAANMGRRTILEREEAAGVLDESPAGRARATSAAKPTKPSAAEISPPP